MLDEEQTLLAEALIASNSSRKGSRLYLSTFLRLVPESGVMLKPITLDIYSISKIGEGVATDLRFFLLLCLHRYTLSQWRCLSPGLHRIWMTGR